MKKLLGSFLVFSIVFFNNINTVNANLFTSPNCSTFSIISSISPNDFFEEDGVDKVTVSIDTTYIADDEYRIKVFDDRSSARSEEASDWQTKVSSTTNLTFELTSNNALTSDDAGANSLDTHHVYLYNRDKIDDDSWCYVGSYDVTKAGLICTQPILISQQRTVTDEEGNESEETCFYNNTSSCLDTQSPVYFSVSGLLDQGVPPNIIYIGAGQDDWGIEVNPKGSATGGEGSFEWNKTFRVGDFSTWIRRAGPSFMYKGHNCDGTSLSIKPSCPPTKCDTTSTVGNSGSDARDKFSLCSQIPLESADQRKQCQDCTGGTEENEGNAGVWTAIGCIDRDPQAIITKLITVGLGLGGGVALLTFLGAGFIMSTSQGDAKRVGEAKEMMTSAVVGLIFIIFSVTMLQFIGSSILKIPGFGS